MRTWLVTPLLNTRAVTSRPYGFELLNEVLGFETAKLLSTIIAVGTPMQSSEQRRQGQTLLVGTTLAFLCACRLWSPMRGRGGASSQVHLACWDRAVCHARCYGLMQPALHTPRLSSHFKSSFSVPLCAMWEPVSSLQHCQAPKAS